MILIPILFTLAVGYLTIKEPSQSKAYKEPVGEIREAKR